MYVVVVHYCYFLCCYLANQLLDGVRHGVDVVYATGCWMLSLTLKLLMMMLCSCLGNQLLDVIIMLLLFRQPAVGCNHRCCCRPRSCELSTTPDTLVCLFG